MRQPDSGQGDDLLLLLITLPLIQNELRVGRNGFAECAGGEVGVMVEGVYFVDAVGRETAWRRINGRKPPCRHYAHG